MDQNPYLRPDLPPTRAGLCDPASEVESRLASLADLLAGWDRQGPGFWDSDLLATLTWFERVGPDFLAGLDREGLVGQGRRLVASEGRALAQRAILDPNPDGWLEEAGTLQASYEEPIDPTERAALAHRLFQDLDDAELACLAAARLGVVAAELDRGLDRCREWLAEHAGAFLSVGVFIQALGQTLRADLARADPPLARTADKVVWILDALEDLESDLGFAGIEPIRPEVVWGLLERSTAGQPVLGPEPQSQDESAFDGPPPGSSRVIPVGAYPFHAQHLVPQDAPRWAAQGEEEEFRPRSCEWIAPDGRYWAHLPVFTPPTFHDSEPVTIEFCEADGAPALGLAGQPVQVGTVSGRIDELGENIVFRLSWSQLRQAGALRLRVGPDLVEWIPRPDAPPAS